MKVLGNIKESVDKLHQYYGTERLEDAMNQVYSEMVQFDYINWLPILEVCVSQKYLPENLLNICMNYFMWKGNMKASAEFARVLKYWKNKGLNDMDEQHGFIPLNEIYREFELEEEGDQMKKILHNKIENDIFNYNTSFFYSGLKALYYSGFLENIMLLRVYFSYNLLYYTQIWEFGVRKLKSFSSYNPGILQQWVNIYFSTTGDNPADEELFRHILPGHPGEIERKKDIFLVLGFHRETGKLIRMVLFRQRSTHNKPFAVWRNQMLEN
ncbi:MAG: hypothetical protein H6540_08575 [Bacteroidales bacterium]|nr:hypothetical protein [Bacteroidales bacterium]